MTLAVLTYVLSRRVRHASSSKSPIPLFQLQFTTPLSLSLSPSKILPSPILSPSAFYNFLSSFLIFFFSSIFHFIFSFPFLLGTFSLSLEKFSSFSSPSHSLDFVLLINPIINTQKKNVILILIFAVFFFRKKLIKNPIKRTRLKEGKAF